MNVIRKMAVLVCIIIAGVGEADAQDPTITISQDLSFGNNITGTTTIAYNNSAAAQFVIEFPAYPQQGNVTISFVLPSNLTDAAGDNLPVSFTWKTAISSRMADCSFLSQ